MNKGSTFAAAAGRQAAAGATKDQSARRKRAVRFRE